jgi:AcrR family transcriptional regulator
MRAVSNMIAVMLYTITIHRWRMQKSYPAKQTAVRHERIVKEASRLFRERGFEKVSVEEVMKAAGLTHGAFYAHFSSKEELKSAAVAHGRSDQP